MRQPSPEPIPYTPIQKVRHLELRSELRELRDAEFYVDYNRDKGELPEHEWSQLKEQIRVRTANVINDIKSITNP